MKKIKSRKWEDRCSTGSVGVQYAFDPEWNQKKCSTITVSASTVSSPVCTGYVCAFSCMERRFGFIGTGGVDQTKSTGVDSSGSVCGRSCRVWIVS